MRSSLSKLHGLLVASLLTLFQVLAGLAILAVLLGRSAPEPANDDSPRQPAHPRYCEVDRIALPRGPGNTPQILDTETGAITPCPIPDARNVGQLCCSPWRDREGQYQLAGLGLDNASHDYALVRCTFPAKRVLFPVRVDVLPSGLPCWSPDRSDRILYSGGQGSLYLYDFPETRVARGLDRAEPRELRWRTEPPGVGRVMIRDPCWPSVPALARRLLVTIGFREDLSKPGFLVKLWWIQLSPDDGEIVSAERAIVPNRTGPGSPQDQERRPGVGMTRDGTPLLAYLAFDPRRAGADLWVMPVAPAASGRGPRLLPSAGRKLAEGCGVGLVPTFSPDGRWVYAAQLVGGKFVLKRFDVSLEPDGPTGARIGQRRFDLTRTPK